MTTARQTKINVEVGYLGETAMRTSKVDTEVAYLGQPAARTSKVLVEVAYIEGVTPPSGGQRFYAQVIG
jgi:hypothetical protein